MDMEQSIGMTPTSGVDWFGDLFTIGTEAFYFGSPNTATLEVQAPFPFKAIEFGQIAVSLRPPDSKSTFFGSNEYFKTDGLFRILADGVNVFSDILKTTFEPANTSTSTYRMELPNPATQLKIVFEQAGKPGQTQSNMELQAVGRIFAA